MFVEMLFLTVKIAVLVIVVILILKALRVIIIPTTFIKWFILAILLLGLLVISKTYLGVF
jgi:hypothetical protein